jgi:DNA-binding HxlR family transcriptional regulator
MSAMRQTSFAHFHCSLARSLEVMGDWWTPLIVRDVDLGISRNLLTRRLAELVANGLLERVPYCQRPLRHRYQLTESSRDLVPVLAALTAWGDRWQTPPGGPPLRFGHDGHTCQPVVTCSTCGEALTTENLEPRAGPGGRVAPGTMVVAARWASPRHQGP